MTVLSIQMMLLDIQPPLPRIVNSTPRVASAWGKVRPNGRASVCPVGVLSDLYVRMPAKIGVVQVAVMITSVYKVVMSLYKSRAVELL